MAMQNEHLRLVADTGSQLSQKTPLASKAVQSNIKPAIVAFTDALLGGGGGRDLPPSQTGGTGGGPGGPGMEARVAVLEAEVKHIRADLDKLIGLPVEVAEIKVKVDNLPTKDWIDTKLHNFLVKMGILMTIIAAIVGIAVKFIPTA
ncbi:MAG: hypothetical protein J7498_05385 [Sphingobium sp.]|nr:hypothetical protein [Sphingobium sp.]